MNLPDYTILFPEVLERDPINPETTPRDFDPIPNSSDINDFKLVKAWSERRHNIAAAFFSGLFDPLPPPAPLSHPLIQSQALRNNEPPPYVDNPDYNPNIYKVDSRGNPLFPHHFNPYMCEIPVDPIPMSHFYGYYRVLRWISRNPYIEILSSD